MRLRIGMSASIDQNSGRMNAPLSSAAERSMLPPGLGSPPPVTGIDPPMWLHVIVLTLTESYANSSQMSSILRDFGSVR